MEFDEDQERTVEDVIRWHRNWTPEDPYYALNGFAGTGKTTLAKYIAAQIRGEVRCAAPTWKAADVLAHRGFPGATSVHSLIYTPVGSSKRESARLGEELRDVMKKLETSSRDLGLARRKQALERSLEEAEREEGKLRFTLRDWSEITSCSLLILDESSMVDERMAEDLLSFGVPILALGDPAQLPPPKGDGLGYFSKRAPHALLTNIHRQARDNPILHLATLARTGEDIPLGTYGDTVRVVESASRADALSADMITTGTNAMRRSINAKIRKVKGYDRALFPCAGEKLCCWRTNRDLGLTNGAIWYAASDTEGDVFNQMISLHAYPEGGDANHADHYRAEGLGFTDDEQLKKGWPDGEFFQFGYALTVHKAQGSQAPNVLVFDNWRWNHRKEWLYTAITRAQEGLVLVKNAS